MRFIPMLFLHCFNILSIKMLNRVPDERLSRSSLRASLK